MSLSQRTSANPANRNAVLDRRLRHGEDLSRDLPSRWAGGASTDRILLKVIDGGTVYSSGPTTVYGISKSGSALTTVSSLWDPNSVGGTAGLFTAETGIGRAQLYLNGVLQSGYVLVCFDSSSPIPTLLSQGDSASGSGTRSLTLDSDPTQSVTAYLVDFL